MSKRVDFTQPTGEPALIAADSVSWIVFKNPVATFIGGITAVILELAEPRVRAGVWDHTTFRTDPRTRLRRTGLAAMVSVYGSRSVAEAMIAGVTRAHGRVSGVAANGEAYHANQQELLDWVQATASFGFLEAYRAYVRSLGEPEADRFYAESEATARLYGAAGAPTSSAMLAAQFDAMRPRLEPSPIVVEFLEIMGRAEVLPRVLRPLQRLFVRAAVAIVPAWAIAQLDLDDPRWRLRRGEAWLVRTLGRFAERVLLRGSPAVQACQRLGLPDDHLYERPLLRI